MDKYKEMSPLSWLSYIFKIRVFITSVRTHMIWYLGPAGFHFFFYSSPG